MEKTRQSKVLSIVALVLAILSMSLGFAAFSTTLNIASSATVTPNSEDFKVTVYGFVDQESLEAYTSDYILKDSYLSSTTAAPIIVDDSTGSTAVIDNSTHTINNLVGNFKSNNTAITYPFIIKNEGKYDAYLDLSQFTYEDGQYTLETYYPGTCVAGEGTTPSLVEETCQYTIAGIFVNDSTSDVPIVTSSSYYEIPKGSYIMAGVAIGYVEAQTLADGPFTVTFDDIKLNFSTAK